MLVHSHHKRPARLVALAMRFELLVALVGARTIIPERTWQFSPEPLDVFLQSSLFLETVTKPSSSDRCENESERSGDNNRTETLHPKLRKTPGSSLTTSVALIQVITSKRLASDDLEQTQRDTVEENMQEATSWPKYCVGEVLRCYLPIQHDSITLVSLNKNETAVSSNITTQVE
jgi:hypothetical protein